jgi:hypothetical protein
MHPVHKLQTYFCKIHSNVILPFTTKSSKLSVPSGLPTRIFKHYWSPTCMLHAPPISFSCINKQIWTSYFQINIFSCNIGFTTQANRWCASSDLIRGVCTWRVSVSGKPRSLVHSVIPIGLLLGRLLQWQCWTWTESRYWDTIGVMWFLKYRRVWDLAVRINNRVAHVVAMIA